MLRELETESLVLPRYTDCCISNLPATILHSYGVKYGEHLLPWKISERIKGYGKIVVLVMDGLPYDLVLSIFPVNHITGDLFPLTSVFPSTTASALTTFHTGLTPQEHGIPEWHVYFEELDMMFEALPFRPANEEDRNRFLKMRVKPKELFGWQTVYQKLKKKGVKSFTFTRRRWLGEAYAREALKGSIPVGYISLADLVVKLRKILTENLDLAYIWIYWNLLDSVSHVYGFLTEEAKTEVFLFLSALEREVIGKLKKSLKDTLFLLTSDHGQITVNPMNTIYLSAFQKLRSNLRLRKDGRRLLPGGSPRDLFVYIKEDKVEEVAIFLEEKLRDDALVLRSEEAIKKGLFGKGKVRRGFKSRIGDLVIIPVRDRLVWYRRRKGDDLRDPGYHGGLSREEIIIPLLVMEVSSFKSLIYPNEA